ncbi:MAG: hypothetical protein ACXW3R_11895 [Rhodoplanes sp.]
MAEMLNHHYARTGQWAVVYFISDLDPSGLDLQRAWEEALKNFGVRVAAFVRIGLTREQVDALDNPRLRRGIDVKPSDSRSKSYIAQYGGRCWETDILPASVIEQALDVTSAPGSTPSCGSAATPRSSAPALCYRLPPRWRRCWRIGDAASPERPPPRIARSICRAASLGGGRFIVRNASQNRAVAAKWKPAAVDETAAGGMPRR